MRSRFFSPLAGPLHALQHVGVAVLERHVQVRQHLARRHQRDHLVDMRYG
jgi:hypothetical protein